MTVLLYAFAFFALQCAVFGGVYFAGSKYLAWCDRRDAQR